MQELKSSFISNFIDDNRWRYITDGLKITLLVTVFAVLIGVVLGFLIAIVRTTHDKTGKLKILNAICKVYLTVIRGTPVVVQLMIIYFTRVHMLLRYSVLVLCLSITDSLKQGEALDLTMHRR